MSDIQVGDTLTQESTANQDVPPYHYHAVVLSEDGSRKVLAKAPIAFPGWNEHAKRAVLEQLGPRTILWGSARYYSVDVGQYLPYPESTDPAFRPTSQVFASDVPTNQIPYVLHMKGHMGNVSHEFVESPLSDLSLHLNSMTGFAPTGGNHLDSETQEKYELVTWNIRRLVGALWQQVEERRGGSGLVGKPDRMAPSAGKGMEKG